MSDPEISDQAVSRRLSTRALHPETPRWLPRAVVLVLVLWWSSRLVVSVATSLRTVIITIVASFVVASALELPVARLTRAGLRRGLATAIVLIGLVLSLIGLTTVVGALVAHQVMHLVTHAPEIAARAVSSLNHTLHTHFSAEDVRRRLAALSNHASASGSHAWEAKSLSTVGQLGNVLMGLLITFYFTAEGPQMRRFVCSLTPPDSQSEMMRAWEIAVEKTSNYFVSRLVLSALRIVVLGITLLVLHVPAWLALALWFGVVAEFIPVIGTALGVALPVMVALTVSPTTALITLIVLTVFTQIRNMILAPRISRRAVNVHPAVAFVAVVAVAKVVGPAGTLLAIPVVATVQAFVVSYVTRHDLVATSDLLHDHPRPR